jgi:hypothetical protein
MQFTISEGILPQPLNPKDLNASRGIATIQVGVSNPYVGVGNDFGVVMSHLDYIVDILSQLRLDGFKVKEDKVKFSFVNTKCGGITMWRPGP